jgi:hypothetical protein
MEKIFDILPPQKIKEKKKEKKTPAFPILKKRFFWFTLGFGIFFGIFALLVLPKAEISIWPKLSTLDFGAEINLDSKVNQINFSQKTLPLKVVEEEKEFSEKFEATKIATVEKKSQGVIRVYNTCWPKPQPLVATTRFVSDDGKLFRTKRRIVVPATSKGQSTFTEVEVIAAKAGQEYNIGPSTFSIPGLVGTPQYTCFYGKSLASMSGGFKGQVKKVSKEDLERAKKILTEKALAQAKESIKSQLSKNEILIEGAVDQQISETSSVKPGEEKEFFELSFKVKTRALVFKKSDLENLAKTLLFSKLKEGQELWEESFKLSFEPKEIDFKKERLILDLKVEGQVFASIDQQDLKRKLMGKGVAEISEFFAKDPEVLKAKTELWPFWVKKVPKNEKKIYLQLNFSLD